MGACAMIVRKCPKCGATEQQIKSGHNKSGTQRFKCKECGARYTLEPKRMRHSNETKELAMQLYEEGMSGREIGRLYEMDKENVFEWIKKGWKS